MYVYIYISSNRAIKTSRTSFRLSFSIAHIYTASLVAKFKMALGYCTVTLHFTVVAIFSHHHHGISHSFDASFPSKIDENRKIDRLMMKKVRKKERKREKESERASERKRERECVSKGKEWDSSAAK